MKKILALFVMFSLAVPAFSDTGTGKDDANGDYLGVGGGLIFPVQNAAPDHHGVFSLVGGHNLNPNLVAESELDAAAYSAGYNGGVLDLRLFETLKLMIAPDPAFQPYLLAGFGFQTQLGIDTNGVPNLAGFDFVGGLGVRTEVAKGIHLFADWKMQMLIRDAPTAIDAPLTGGLLFHL